MYKYVLNLVIKISLMFAQYFEYYTIILRGPFFCGHCTFCTMRKECTVVSHPSMRLITVTEQSVSLARYTNVT